VQYHTRIARIVCVAGTTQNLPRLAWQVVGATYANGVATAGSVVKVTALAPASTNAPTTTTAIGFKGTPAAPAAALYLKTAAVAGVEMLVEYVPPGGTAA
jgi:hypothetical protein